MKKYVFAIALLICPMMQAIACHISAHGIGGIKLGQSIKQVKKAFPQARFEQVNDAEGAEFTQITLNPTIKDFSKNIIVFAHTDDNTGKIEYLETTSSLCKTTEGIHPQMSLKYAEQKLGKLQNIMMSEIEMRQFAEFSRQPKWLTMRVDGGNFGTLNADDLVLPLYTHQFHADAKIISLMIAK